MNPQNPGDNYGNNVPPGQGGYYAPQGGNQGYPPPAGGYPPPPQGYPGQQPYGNYGQQPNYGGGYSGQTPPPKKSNSGLIIGLIAGLVVVIVAVVLIIFLVIKPGDNNNSNASNNAATATASATEAKTTAGTTQAVNTVTVSTTKSTTTAPLVTGTGNNSGIPVYPGIKKVNLPQSLVDDFGSSVNNNPNVKLEGFSSPDQSTIIKFFYQSEFAKAGWTDASNALADSTASDSFAMFEQMGGFVVAYQKGNSAEVILGLPGAIMSASGNPIDGVKSGDTVLIVISGTGDAESLMGSSTSTTTKTGTTGRTTTAAPKATATVAAKTSSTQGGSVGGVNISVYPGAKKIEMSQMFKDIWESTAKTYPTHSLDLYMTGDTPDQVKDFFKQDLQGKTTYTTESSSAGQQIVIGVTSDITTIMIVIFDKQYASQYTTDPAAAGKTVYLVLVGKQ